MHDEISEAAIQAFRDRVLAFYDRNGRELPWRQTTDRYRILVSEVMLQQTQVSRVVPKYEEWIDRWPTPAELAAADFDDVLGLWKGLGYNNRPRRLQDSAQIIVDEHDGQVPGTEEELLELPGVGPYTAHAVLIFADNRDIVTVDTNIRRVLIDAFDLDEDVGDDRLHEIAARCLPEGRSREWHNALMDYGAMEKTSHATGISSQGSQSSFEGSDRYYRGQILDLLLEAPMTQQELEDELDRDGGLDDILVALEDDDMVTVDEDRYRLTD